MLPGPQAPGAVPPPPGYVGGRYGGYGMATPLPPPSRNADSFSQRLQAIVARAGAEPETEPLLICSSEVAPAVRANLKEDLIVMSHILDKASGGVSGPGLPGRAMGVALAFPRTGQGSRDLYLEGYGAVFMLRVAFPLLPPSDKQAGVEEKRAPDSEWETAKRELQGQPADALPGAPEGEPYKEEHVSQVQTALLEALRNASNIRGLKPEESVTVCVIGPGTRGSGPAAPAGWRPLRVPTGADMVAADSSRAAETMLTIKAAKSDIDAFAKGKTNIETFREKAKTIIYSSD